MTNNEHGSEASRARLKAKVLAEIAAHVAIYGRRNWDLIRENPQYAHLIGREAGESGKRTFWRWVNAACGVPPVDKTRPHEGREAATAALAAATERARAAALKHLPAAPSPAYLMREGARAAKQIDFLAAIHLVWADAERLRDDAVDADENAPGHEKIVDLKLFDRSINRRLEVIQSALRVMQTIYDFQHQQRFNSAITDILVEELAAFPEVQERVIRRLTDLNNRSGITIYSENT
jgi:hypothetical protein